MGTSKSSPNKWMIRDGNNRTTADNTFAGPGGWYLRHPDGRVELLHAMAGVAEVPPNAPDVMSVDNPLAGNYSVGAGDVVVFVVNWTEPVVITGTPQINFNENAVPVTADYVAASSTSLQSVFEFAVTTEGAIDTVTTAVQLNGGTIVGGDAVAASLTPVFSADTVASVTVVSGGTGYDGTETITFDAPNKANVTATVDVLQTGGVIDSVTLVNGGYGYATGTILIPGGDGTATVDIVAVNGVITTAVINFGGTTGYTDTTENLAAPTLTVTTATGTVVLTDQAVSSITMTDVGYGYDGLEGYTLVAPVGTPAVLTFPAGYVQPTGVTVVA